VIGKLVRLGRIGNRSSGRTVIIPVDHGITQGPIPGLRDAGQVVEMAAAGGADAVIMHKGTVRAAHRGSGPNIGLIVHLSASTCMCPDPDDKVLVCTVEEAVKLGADGVSIHVNLGARTEQAMLKLLGKVSAECMTWGMPLLAMMYARGESMSDSFETKRVKHAARVGAELGADIVKCVYTGSPDSFREVVEGCPVPVVIAGGEKTDTDRSVLEMVAGSLEAGGKGVSIGRNAFQHQQPDRMVAALCRLVHERASVDEALRFLQSG
jgi:class I fructose-bisphosphate aldolase